MRRMLWHPKALAERLEGSRRYFHVWTFGRFLLVRTTEREALPFKVRDDLDTR